MVNSNLFACVVSFIWQELRSLDVLGEEHLQNGEDYTCRNGISRALTLQELPYWMQDRAVGDIEHLVNSSCLIRSISYTTSVGDDLSRSELALEITSWLLTQTSSRHIIRPSTSFISNIWRNIMVTCSWCPQTMVRWLWPFMGSHPLFKWPKSSFCFGGWRRKLWLGRYTSYIYYFFCEKYTIFQDSFRLNLLFLVPTVHL